MHRSYLPARAAARGVALRVIGLGPPGPFFAKTGSKIVMSSSEILLALALNTEAFTYPQASSALVSTGDVGLKMPLSVSLTFSDCRGGIPDFSRTGDFNGIFDFSAPDVLPSL
ncbi:hypothetical protein EVAR_89031_1 [Eumeta japonica]|uniref:Uncharacterized protein n=1 Tax=Eumeta variegata TaxID=151549 RepID=A0A4C1Z4C2_EUMVA|nr:hypothetical protein EVAR_89031_1 [Eumeta japonica]